MKMTARNTKGFYFLINFCRRKLFRRKIFVPTFTSLSTWINKSETSSRFSRGKLYAKFTSGKLGEPKTTFTSNFPIYPSYIIFLKEQKENNLELLQPKRGLRRDVVRSVLKSLSQNETKIRFMELENLRFRVWKFQQNRYEARTKRLRTLGESRHFPDKNSWKHRHKQIEKISKIPLTKFAFIHQFSRHGRCVDV